MTERQFVDHYEVLQVSQNADTETIERVYRLLAKRYHPDNQTSGDAAKFSEVQVAYELLAKPEQRAQYDITYDDEKGHQWRIFNQESAADAPDQDREVFHGILSLLYVARRRDPENGGLGAVHLERTLAVPREHLEFPLWYLMKRGWIERLLGGRLAITVDGVDVLGDKELSLPRDRLIEESESRATRQPIGKERRLSGKVAPATTAGAALH